MQTTETNLEEKKQKLEKKSEDKTHSLESTKKSSLVISKESNQLSKNLALSLMTLIEKVNETAVTPETVNASCNAAAQIYKILRLNYEMQKEGM